MKVSIKGVVTDAYVRDMRFRYQGVAGDLPDRVVREAWLNGVKIYPDEKVAVDKVGLGFLKEENLAGYDTAWDVALYAAKNKVYGTLVGVQLGNIGFHLGVGDGTLPVLEYEASSGDWKVPADIELLVADCTEEFVPVYAVVPEVRQNMGSVYYNSIGQVTGTSYFSPLRPVYGEGRTKITYRHQAANVASLEFWGMYDWDAESSLGPVPEDYDTVLTHTQASGMSTVTYELEGYSYPLRRLNLTVNLAVTGTPVGGVISGTGSGGAYDITMVFPAFSKLFKLKVLYLTPRAS